MLLNTLVLLAGLASGGPVLAPTASPTTAEEHGKLTWFEGSWEELLATAQKTKKLVFVDFWTDWWGYCKKLDKVTFTSDSVVTEMNDLLCYSVDAESDAGSEIAAKYGVRGFPTLLFLEPDGSVRDKIGGFLPPEPFVDEVQRIKANRGTVTALKDKVATDPADLDARWELAKKLEAVGDQEGRDAQIEEIRRLDPEGKSLGARTLRFMELKQKAVDAMDFQPVYAFMEKEQDPSLLLDGWYFLWQVENYLVENAETEEEAATHLRLWMSAARALWANAPGDLRARIGGEVAGKAYARLEDLGPDDRALLAQVAAGAVEAAPEDPSLHGILARWLAATGRLDEARKHAQRALDLDPKNVRWNRLLSDLEKQS